MPFVYTWEQFIIVIINTIIWYIEFFNTDTWNCQKFRMI